MEAGKQYKVSSPDGFPFGYFLDGRLYEYRTSTCIGFLNEAGHWLIKTRYWGTWMGINF